jgi:5-(carboxyamino)imidazole ribonucleotide synthase
MVNIIGSMPRAREFLQDAGVHWHDYGKSPRPGRKLGHVTVVKGNRAARDRAARQLRRRLIS